jgi:hypothetical protein
MQDRNSDDGQCAGSDKSTGQLNAGGGVLGENPSNVPENREESIRDQECGRSQRRPRGNKAEKAAKRRKSAVFPSERCLEDSAASIAESSLTFGDSYERSQEAKNILFKRQLALEDQKPDMRKYALLLDPSTSSTEEGKKEVRKKMILSLFKSSIGLQENNSSTPGGANNDIQNTYEKDSDESEL